MNSILAEQAAAKSAANAIAAEERRRMVSRLEAVELSLESHRAEHQREMATARERIDALERTVGIGTGGSTHNRGVPFRHAGGLH